MQSSGTPDSCWNLGAVKIGSKTDAVLTYMFENVLEVLDHQVNGGVSILMTVRAEVASSEVDADYPNAPAVKREEEEEWGKRGRR